MKVVGRIRDVSDASPNCRRADGERVSFAGVPCYVGPLQYLAKRAAVKRAALRSVGERDAAVLRGPGQLSFLVEPYLRRAGRPYGTEVTGDSYDVFGPGSVSHPFRPLLRMWFARRTRGLCGAAAGAAYVTRDILQRRYPCPAASFGVSDVELTPDWFAGAGRPPCRGHRAVSVVTVGSLAQRYKAVDVLIEAGAACVRRGTDLRLVIVGDGRHRSELERAAAARLPGRVRFLGRVQAGDGVRAALDQADLFVLPSKAEGLPRAMVEAMARALPCIGSTVGGIPELLPPEDLVPPGDAPALARKLREVVSDPARMARMSERNLAAARAYRADALRGLRVRFYSHLRDATERWARDGR